jgi:hypothetical protein
MPGPSPADHVLKLAAAQLSNFFAICVAIFTLVVALAEWVMWCGVGWLSVGLLVTGSSLG